MLHKSVAALEKICNFGGYLESVMNNTDFPTITTVVQAEPWKEGHVARISSPRPLRRFCKQLIYNILPPPINSEYELVSSCKPAAYTILPPKACTLSGGIFCALFHPVGCNRLRTISCRILV